MGETTAPVLLSRDGAVSTIRFNRPSVLNALDESTAAAFRDACRAVAADPETRVLVIAGNGRGFMAGGDLARFRADGAADIARAIIEALHDGLMILDRLEAPVIASVHGPVAGAGMSVAMATDLCIAADDAKFTLAYARIGTTPDGSSTYNLPRLVGLRRAMEIALLADTIDAEEARHLGLVNRVVPAAALAAETAALSARLAAGPTRAYAGIRRLLRDSWTSGLEGQLAAERDAFCASAGTEDFKEGIEAFFGKRRAEFHGR